MIVTLLIGLIIACTTFEIGLPIPKVASSLLMAHHTRQVVFVVPVVLWLIGFVNGHPVTSLL